MRADAPPVSVCTAGGMAARCLVSAAACPPPTHRLPLNKAQIWWNQPWQLSHCTQNSSAFSSFFFLIKSAFWIAPSTVMI